VTVDRTTRGLLAGIIAGIVMNAWNLFDYYFLHITRIRFLDWVSILGNWAISTNNLEIIFLLIFQTVIWDGFLGIIFVHLVKLTTSKGIIYKSVFYSSLCWFFFKIIVNFYRVPVLSGGTQTTPGLLSNFLAAILWGIILGFVLKKLEKTSSTYKLGDSNIG
jgi:hypothetical protein